MKAKEIAIQILDCIRARQEYYYQNHIEDMDDVEVIPHDTYVELSIWGGGIVLNEDGTWYWNDTSGG